PPLPHVQPLLLSTHRCRNPAKFPRWLGPLRTRPTHHRRQRRLRPIPTPPRLPPASRFLLGPDQRHLRQRHERSPLLRSAEFSSPPPLAISDAQNAPRPHQTPRPHDRLH